MNKKITSVILSIVMLLCFLLSVTGCEEDDGKDYIFGYNIPSNPATLDPQCANDKQSFLIIGNVFEGLTKCDGDGNIILAGAKSYTVSPDKLKYVFDLHDDRYWTDMNGYSAKVTAKDYEFAFIRLLNPETRAPAATDFYCIENAMHVNKGHTAHIDNIGVKATAEYELTITLETPNPSLLMLLSTAAAMPCNEEYFLNAQGKYGLTAKTTPSNSAFYLKSWSYDPWSSDNNNLVLRRNDKYSEINEVCPLGLNFFIEPTEGFAEDFLSEISQNIVLDGEKAKIYADEGYSYHEYSTVVYGIMMNTTDSVFKNSFLRYSLLYTSDNSNLNLPFGYEKASGAVPFAVKTDGKSYREYVGNSQAVKLDSIKAHTAYSKACETIDKQELKSITLIAVEGRDEEIVNSAQDIIQQWQKELGFFVTVRFLSQSAYDSCIESGNYSLALARYTGKFNTPSAYLENFTKTHFVYSAMSDDYEALLDKAEKSTDKQQSYDYAKQAEKMLLTDGRFIPIAYATEYFFSGKGVSGVEYNAFSGAIDYTKAIFVED